MEKELLGRQWDDRMDAFSNGEFISRNFVCAGLFYNGNSQYLDNMAKLAKKLIDRQKVDGELKGFLENLNYKVSGNAIYSRQVVNRWVNLFKVVKSDQKVGFYRKSANERFDVAELDLGNPSDIQHYAGIIFLRIRGYEDQELSEELKYDLRQELLEEWLEVAEDRWVREYLKRVKEILEDIKRGVYGSHYRFPFSTLAYYLFPVNFDRFENVILVSSVSMYNRRPDTKQNLWQELQKTKDFEDLKGHLESKGKSLRDLEELLDQAFKEENLARLRKDWLKFIKKVLNGGIESRRLVGAFLKKRDRGKKTSVSYGYYEVPARNLELFLFYEDGIENRYIELLKDRLAKFKYAGDVKISVKNEKPIPIHSLFGGEEYFRILKGLEGGSKELRHEESVKLLYALAYFTARLNGFLRLSMEQKEKLIGALLLLNTNLERDQRYDFWDSISFLYDYYGVPFQTVTKRFLSILENGKGSSNAIKNMLISLYKDTKILHFNFDGFKLPEEVVVYVILEKPSPRFFYEKSEMSLVSASRHYMYEVYTIKSKGNEASIELEDKFFVMCDYFGDDVDRLKEYIKQRIEDKRSRFCFISALKDGYAKVLYEDMCSYSDFERKALFIRYKELKTAYVSQRADNDCLVIYTQQFNELAKTLGIRLDEDAAAIAIKPARPSREFEDIYHPALQVFYTEKIGWSSDEVYSQQHNLFLFTLIALSMYESEAFQVPYSKLSLYSKERNIYLNINRQTNEGLKSSYRFPLRTLLYELVEFFRHLPGDKEVS
ncbi:hypothetical protein [Pampinifervens florentissimum]|uniref:hypothetical protein n=1 Tax=Pampinifervens florentissimum TaxID=1632019 RepID=UPI0013B49B07|nr:hypothetical protein [Hydrogenobacter sp. T-8]QID33030.1 hypothetical protein G3M65_04300 [Hydrogenobacter sp. T-8]